jgi:hypothetical protein
VSLVAAVPSAVSGAVTGAVPAGGPDWAFLSNNKGHIVNLFAWHAWLSVIPVVIGLVIALPIGWTMNRLRWSYPPLVSLAGILYTIPCPGCCTRRSWLP